MSCFASFLKKYRQRKELMETVDLKKGDVIAFLHLSI